jgi:transporter family-2 protein
MSPRVLVFMLVGIAAGSLMTLQGVLNAGLGKRTGPLGSVLLLLLLGLPVVLPLILLFPGTAHLNQLPGPSEWYLYIGVVLGIGIVAVSIVLVPRIGATLTVTALVVGQLTVAVVLDQVGFLGIPKVEITPARLLGVALLIAGTLLITRR